MRRRQRATLMSPAAIAAWVAEVRAGTDGPFQLNLWIPDPPPARDLSDEAKMRAFLAEWGPEVTVEAGDAVPPDLRASATRCSRRLLQSYHRSWASTRPPTCAA
jgi:hypothetical protein